MATLAEFRAFAVSGDVTEPEPEEPSEPVGPQPFVTLTEGDLSVDLHENFPQIIGYELDGKKADGNKGEALNKVAINGIEYDAHATEASVSGAKAVWTVSVPAHEGLSFDVTASITDGVIRVELSNLKDADKVVQQVSFPGLDLVTLSAADAGASLVSTQMSVDRNKPGDLFETVASAQTGNRAAWLVVPSTSEMSFGMESNAIADHTSKNARPGNGLNARWVRSVSESGANKQITVSPGVFTWLGAAVAQHAPGIGYDENPWLEIKPTLDANSDNAIDWQDGATALRDIRPKAAGMEDVKNTVITRIPFNIVSQATHPFLRTLDDTKRIGLATDGLGQQVMLKGYEAEGHDSAHPDYAGHYNTRAGGLEELNLLAEEAEDWNAKIGVHVNTTETYSEAYNFSEDLITMPPEAAWGWMNQSYYIDSAKDLATGNVLKRFQQFYDEKPDNLTWLYVDVYYPDGWQAQRLGKELAKQGWVVTSEWADKLPDQNLWSHWANDENYGGSTNKGINSQVFRYVDNANRDLGVSDEQPACAQAKIGGETTMKAGQAATITTTIVSEEATTVQGATHELIVPEGWTAALQTKGESTIEPGGSSTATWLVIPKPGETTGALEFNGSYGKAETTARFAVSTTASAHVLQPLREGGNYLSDLAFAKIPSNGWGPVERDQANGEQGQGDGPDLSLGGTEYDKGLGTHATSQIEFDLNAQCTAFSAIVGVDDFQGTKGSVTFLVEDGNGTVLAGPTPVLTGASAPHELTADLTGVERLVLKVGDGGNGVGNDWADWADAKIDCEAAPGQNLSISTSVAEVEVGTEFEVTVEGFDPDGEEIVLTGQDGAVLGTLAATDEGTVKVTLDNKTPAGDYAIVATQKTDSGTLGTATLIKVINETVIVDPEIELSVTEVAQGEAVTITGTGYLAGEQVNLTLGAGPTDLGSAIADEDGNFTHEVTIPADTETGAHRISATGVSSESVASADLTVTVGSGDGDGDGSGDGSGDGDQSTDDTTGGKDDGSLPITGTNLLWSGSIMLLLLVGGGAFVIYRKRTAA